MKPRTVTHAACCRWLVTGGRGNEIPRDRAVRSRCQNRFTSSTRAVISRRRASRVVARRPRCPTPLRQVCPPPAFWSFQRPRAQAEVELHRPRLRSHVDIHGDDPARLCRVPRGGAVRIDSLSPGFFQSVKISSSLISQTAIARWSCPTITSTPLALAARRRALPVNTCSGSVKIHPHTAPQRRADVHQRVE